MGSRGSQGSCRLLAAGGPQFRLSLGLFLVGCPDRLARLRLLERNALHLRRDAIERRLHAQAPALLFEGTAGAKLLEHPLRLEEALLDRLLDLLVRDLDPELVRRRLEHELAGHRSLRLVVEARDELVGRSAGDLEVRLEARAAAAHHLVHLADERARARIDEWA